MWIFTGNPEALAAVHEFLRFQIKDHRTNDPLVSSETGVVICKQIGYVCAVEGREVKLFRHQAN